MAAFKREKRKKSAGAISGSKEGVKAQLPSSEPEIGAYGSHCVQGHYRGAASNLQSWATLAESAGYTVAIGSKLPGKMRHLWFDLQEQTLYGWCLCCRRRRSTVFWPWIFADDYFWSQGIGEHHAIVCRSDYGSNWQHQVTSPVAMFYRSNGSWSHGNEVSWIFHSFYFLLVCERVRHKSGADFPLTQIILEDGVRRAMSLLIPNSSAINFSVSRRFCVNICRTF